MMQLIPLVKQSLDPRFLSWYLATFTNQRMCYVHWSASYRHQNWPDYHTVICDDVGKLKIHRNTPITEDLPAHSFQRNHNSWAVCVSSMHGATTNNLGKNAPSAQQLIALANELADNCMELRVPVGRIMTHAEAADNLDGRTDLEYYGPKHGCERWDFAVDVNPLTLVIEPHQDTPRPGRLHFPDWLRGEVITEIQRMTEKQWNKPGA